MTTKPTLVCDCFAIRQAARVITQIYDRHVSKSGISGSQFTILAFIRSSPGISMTELADELMMDRTSLLRALKPLTRDEYVSNDYSGSAVRKARLGLSKLGEKKLAEAEVYWADAQKEWEERVGAKRAKALRKELIQVTQL